MALTTAYEILGVSEGATLDEIRQAYRVRALQFHPDRGGKVEHFVRINEAYEILMDSNLREKLGMISKFERLPLRIQPSLSQATTTLFENLTALEDRLKAVVKK